MPVAAGEPFTGDLHALAIDGALWDTRGDRSCSRTFSHPDLNLGTSRHFIERQVDDSFDIAAAAWPGSGAAPARQSAEQPFEVDASCATENTAELLFPVRWTELLAAAMATQVVVSVALLRITQRLVGLGDFLEALFRIFLFRDVGMELAGKATVGFLDVLVGGAALDAEGLVVVFVFHREFRLPSVTRQRSDARPPSATG